jgi:Uma2 family endonuclease
MSVQVLRRHFSVGEYYKMAAAGLFTEDDRVELIEGEIIEMNPIGSRHAACVGRLTELLGRLTRDVAIVWVQNPVQVNDYSEPVPDVTLLKRRDDFYAQANPGPEAVLLLIEVSDSTLEYDQQVKLPLYARARVPEVWIINIPEETIEVYARPSRGKYQGALTVGRGERLTSTSVPSLTLDADAVLG